MGVLLNLLSKKFTRLMLKHMPTIQKGTYYFIFMLICILTPSFLWGAENNSRIDSLQKQLINTDNDSVRFACYIDLAAEYLFNDVEEAEDMALLALSIAEKNGWEHWVTSAHLYLGHTYQGQNRYSDALAEYELAINRARKYKDIESEAYGLVTLSAYYAEFEFYEKSLEYAYRVIDLIDNLYAENILTEAEYMSRKSYTLKSMGRTHLKMERYTDALAELKEALDLMQWRRPFNKLQAMQLIAETYSKMGDEEKTQQYLKEAIQITERHTVSNLRIDLCNDLALSFATANKMDSAYRYATMAVNEINQGANPALALDAFKIIADYYKSIHDYQTAFEYAERHQQWQDTVFQQKLNAETTQAIKKAAFEEGYLLQEKELQVKQLHNIIIIGVLAFLIILFILLFILQRTTLKKRNVEKDLLEKEKNMLNQDIKSKNKELSSKVMYILRRNNLIEEVINGLKKLQPYLKKEQLKQLRDIVNNLNEAFDENIWQEFEMKFVHVHVGFYEKLQADFPDLTLNEKRMCAFIRMNLATKEISYFTGMRPNTIDVARTRLRKKFNLTNSGQTLEAFLANY